MREDGGVAGLVKHFPLRVVAPVHLCPPQQYLQLGHVALLAGVLVTGHNSGHFLLLPRGEAVQEGGLPGLTLLIAAQQGLGQGQPVGGEVGCGAVDPRPDS